MKTRLCTLLPLFFLIAGSLFRAQAKPVAVIGAPDALVAAVAKADDERVAASIAADRARLEAVLSDQLHYAHSNGAVDTKASYIESIVAHRSVYEGYRYQARTFTPVAPGVVMMTGRALINSRNAEGPVLLDLNFLALWREENGVWRFVAWQSSRNPPAPKPPA